MIVLVAGLMHAVGANTSRRSIFSTIRQQQFVQLVGCDFVSFCFIFTFLFLFLLSFL